MRIDPEQAEAFYKQALIYLRAGKYDQAIGDYDRVILSYPEFTPALINRGAAYAATGRYDRAIDDYSRAIRLRPDGGAFYNRALAYQRTEAYFYIGQYNLLLGRKEEAAQAFRAALAQEADALVEYRGTQSALARLEAR